ncbi:MAG: 50S ribosomal protein L6 [Candidatus Jorgensenbacteria bacterium GW2011_GWA1_48_11]|uniref:Large ribosomal subunit protein uL6 n=1 Tax=Candidatus Jorgensenbacteria bacterium GW2011_GWA1_48_11 TaxID=1618660 RepID=A0A0G1U9S6_9BACT|nr:MAG: 50S ribosomal protein L6 [Candidatus Jorgensenbacteria bacterium GW2011_GWA1_48_11]KKW12370.1 MAG: 50S ribosomal protein L6 [Candidatus Jorgensenbacteria bacterium GW2011_GWB1_49_9]
MSKIGKQPIKIPAGVTCEIKETEIAVKGPKGEIDLRILPGIKPVIAENELTLEPAKKTKQVMSNWGTLRSLAANAVKGVTEGFEKTLMLEGVGFRIAKDGEGLALSLGFSHPVKYAGVKGITFEVEKNTILKIRGFDKGLVGQVAAEIRMLKKPEPYKGKGFHYANEVIRRKAGKKAATTGTAAA